MAEPFVFSTLNLMLRLAVLPVEDATPYQEAFFYDYAVLCYDLRFTYKGKDYYIVNWNDCYALTDETREIMHQTFPDAIELLEQLEIDGIKLLQFMEEIEDVEAL